jgi:hypothetical protein
MSSTAMDSERLFQRYGLSIAWYLSLPLLALIAFIGIMISLWCARSK